MLKEGVGFSSVKRFFKDRAQIIKESHGSIEVSSLKEVASVELDEMFHFIKKRNKGFVGLAVDCLSRKVLDFEVGSRGKKTLKHLIV